jgi:hypothetical protein
MSIMAETYSLCENVPQYQTINLTGRPMKANPQPPFQGSTTRLTKPEHATLCNANNCSAKRRFLFLKADAELRFLLASAQHGRCKLIGFTMWRSNAYPINVEEQHRESYLQH